MSDVAVGFLLNLVALFAIGFGPSLWLLSGTDRAGIALAVGPVVGLVLISVVGTNLTLFDWPVSYWATPVLTAGTFASIVLTALAIRGDPSILSISDRRILVVPLTAFVCTALLVMAPQIVGGLEYSILRGNGTDSFNYLTGAGALDHESLSWISSADLQSLVNRHPSYIRAHALVETRWTTMMMLAFSSRIASIDPYRFEYAFSALCMLLAFGPAFIWCNRLIDVPPFSAALTAAAVSVGFWGQFVLDARADAHQNVLPVLLLLGVVVVRIEALEDHRIRWGEHILLGLIATAILFIYPEIAPMTLLGLVIFLGIRMVTLRTSVVRLTGWVFSACLALMAVLPLRTMLIRFAAMQANYAQSGVNTWHLAYFPWLYSSPLTGLWGFGPLVAGDTITAQVLRVALLPLGALLTIVLAMAIVRARFVAVRYPGLTLSSTLATAALLQWGYLYSRGQLWAGGKGLSFGYPFLIISVVGYALARKSSTFTRWGARWQAAAAIGVMSFLLLQGALALYRPWLAVRGRDYVGYIQGHAEYRRHDWDLAPLERVLNQQQGLTVWSEVSNPWVAHYIGLVLGWDVHLVHIGASLDRVELSAPNQRTDRPPDYLILDNSFSHGGSPHRRRGVVATTDDLSLIKVDGSPTLTRIENPNGVEGKPDALFFWLGGEPTILNVLTASDGCGLLRASFGLGPSRPDLPYRHLTIATTVDTTADRILIRNGPIEIPFRTTPGMNRIQLHVEEKATLFLPTDKRPLLLRVDNLGLERVPCAIPAR